MFNLLDTPGHEDFSEDTYRTLTAADAAVMVLDAAKGIEPQTLKLFEVCRLRDIPIVTFINKMDREAQDPFALLDEIASQAGARPRAALLAGRLGRPLQGHARPARRASSCPSPRRAPTDEEGHPDADRASSPTPSSSYLDPDELDEVEEGAELVQEASKPFDPQSFLEGHMTPVFFGSALRHFGVDRAAGGPRRLRPAAQGRGRRVEAARRPTSRRAIREVSGFVFKVQANMDPNHRDRIAFLRLCLGPVPARHEAEGAEHRPAAAASTRRSCSSPPTANWPRRPSPAT